MTKKRWFEVIFGPPRDPKDPSVYKHLSLIAFLAWVGLGADGLSSACYGPADAFLALGPHRSLAIYLALATVVTVSVLSASYAATIAAFPSGGGGYVVATQTLGRIPGMVCGCALILDYVLTVAISVAAGVHAVSSFWPYLRDHTVEAAVIGVLLLMILNFRGVRESILVLLPIFILFLILHGILILLALFGPVPTAAGAGPMPVQALGLGAALPLVLRAYSHGAGTYTGIEAISNSLQILREPRVQTARRAMLYMAISLALVAGGLLLGFLRMEVVPETGKTLNAVLAERVFGTHGTGRLLVTLALISEATLLLVAAQAGFIAGPRLLASMATDSWVPRWLSRLSDRLVVSNGILIVGLGSLAAILLLRGHVEKLVVVYSISVFMTFLLSQAGMVPLWLRQKGAGSKAILAALATLISLAILGTLLWANGWGVAGATFVVILGMALVCGLVHRHYTGVAKSLRRLTPLVEAAESDPFRRNREAWDKNAPTAVFLVSGYNGAGMHTLLGLQRLFPGYFKQMVFAAVGVVDFARFRGQAEADAFRAGVETEAKRYVALAEKWGFSAEARTGFGVDLVEELEEVCVQVAADYPRAVFFCGDLAFSMPSFITRLLHARTAEEMQRRFRTRGLPLIVLPIRV
jgi:amino acid transporter